MKKKAFISAFILTLFTIQLTFSQDLIIKKTQDTIYCKIKEVETDEIKYLLPDLSDDVIYNIEQEKVRKVVFATGKEMFFQKAMDDPESYIDDNKNAIKVDFLSPLTGNLTFAYERSMKPGRSLEGTLGIVGAGIKLNSWLQPRGVFLRFGMKFIKSPDFYISKMKYAHILKGKYVKPEISFGSFSYYASEEDNASNNRENATSGTIHIVFGNQWVYDNVFCIDTFFGIGYGFYSGNNEDIGGYYFGYIIGNKAFPISFSAGLKVGYVF
jgi:hypothetical protein